MSTITLFGVYALGYPLQSLFILCTVVPFGVTLDYLLHIYQNTGRSGFPTCGLISSLILSSLMPLGVAWYIPFIAITLAIGS